MLAFCIAAAVGGCKLVSTPEWNATQARNRALAEQNRAQLVEIENLRAHARELEDQLLREERLAERRKSALESGVRRVELH
jgi:hypothetical protein